MWKYHDPGWYGDIWGEELGVQGTSSKATGNGQYVEFTNNSVNSNLTLRKRGLQVASCQKPATFLLN
ncbi:hypothetical protein ND16A_3418 [Thalassotalea sp. ND16A]|nr:hypothetical protein ND16A_3418 [Thalassotalea sp. ND16A]